MLESIFQYISLEALILAVPFLFLLGGFLCAVLSFATIADEKAKYNSLTSFVGCFLPILSLAAVTIIFFTLSGFEGTSSSVVTGTIFKWFLGSNFIINIAFRVDELSIVMCAVVTIVGFMVSVYSVGFMSKERGFSRYFAELHLLLFFMLVFSMANDVLMLFVGWEGVGICSYFLINFWFEDDKSSKSALKAFVIDRMASAFLLIGIFLIYAVMTAAGVTTISDIFAFDKMQEFGTYFIPVASWISFLIFAAALIRSAQIPFYMWLTGVSNSPIPVLAIIQTITTVAAGFYLVAKFNFIFALSPKVLNTVAIIGAVTAIFAAVVGLFQNNIKRILGFSTISQAGFMFMAVGVGATSVAVFHLVTHAFFKTLLFFAAGSVVAALSGEEDIRNMGGLKKRMPLTTWAFVIAAAALSGIIPTAGFFSSESILWQVYERGHLGLWWAGFLCQGLTAFYIFRAAGRIFFGNTNLSQSEWNRATEAPVSMALPELMLMTLVFLSGAIGIPAILGGSAYIMNWLSGVLIYEVSHAPRDGSHTELILMVVTLLWSAHFSILGWIIFAQKRDLPERLMQKAGRIGKFLENGF